MLLLVEGQRLGPCICMQNGGCSERMCG